MNIVAITGNLTRAPEAQPMGESGGELCLMRVAVDNGRYDADFPEVKAFGKLGANCAEYLAKGDRVEIRGRLRTESWESDGSKRSKLLVIADQVKFPPKKDRTGASSSSEEPSAAAPDPIGAAAGSNGEVSE